MSRTAVHAVELHRDRTIRWAGSAVYRTEHDLSEVLAGLIAECPNAVSGVHVVLEADAVQVRSLEPAPALSGGAVSRYVALEAPRLFRNGRGGLVTDALKLRAGERSALRIAAAEAGLLAAIAAGCAQAGLTVRSLGPAVELLPWAHAAPRTTGELALRRVEHTELLDTMAGRVWRSRVVLARLPGDELYAPPLAALAEAAGALAAAYAAAAAPRRRGLQLLPSSIRGHQRRTSRLRQAMLAAIAVTAWSGAWLVGVVRAGVAERRARAALAEMAPSLDSALRERADLAYARAALDQLAAGRRAEAPALPFLAELVRILADSVALSAFRIDGDSTVHISGYAPSAPRVLAAVEGMSRVGEPRFAVPVVRELVATHRGPRELERFVISTRLVGSR